jgi:hypothetical protein
VHGPGGGARLPALELVAVRPGQLLVADKRLSTAWRAAPRIRVAPKLGITVLALVNPTMRAVKERLYQTERPFVVDHGKFERAFGATPTPHPQALERTLEWYRSSGS